MIERALVTLIIAVIVIILMGRIGAGLEPIFERVACAQSEGVCVVAD